MAQWERWYILRLLFFKHILKCRFQLSVSAHIRGLFFLRHLFVLFYSPYIPIFISLSHTLDIRQPHSPPPHSAHYSLTCLEIYLCKWFCDLLNKIFIKQSQKTNTRSEYFVGKHLYSNTQNRFTLQIIAWERRYEILFFFLFALVYELLPNCRW